jgi:hypothetical protein
MLFREIMTVYYKNHIKHLKTHFGQNQEYLDIKVGGTYYYHHALVG